ncbi:MAG: iron-sulfur cluster assembly scaffold protein [Deltaproteobacteria bacterium]|nr:iron-sulfur cluster assembly scaffold protein [Deltaproteobacteria bacterium]
MGDDLDNFVEELQNQIFKETKAAYGDVGFERWCNPLFMGRMENPDGYGRIKGSCGDTMEIYLQFENDKVKKASFQTDGCGTSTICGSFAAELAIGKEPDELMDITGETILNILGTVPEEDRHCAFLAAETLQEALHNYMIQSNKMRMKEDELEKEIKELEEILKDREEALPPHSIQLQQMLFLEELDTKIEAKKNKLAELKRKDL